MTLEGRAKDVLATIDLLLAHSTSLKLIEGCPHVRKFSRDISNAMRLADEEVAIISIPDSIIDGHHLRAGREWQDASPRVSSERLEVRIREYASQNGT